MKRQANKWKKQRTWSASNIYKMYHMIKGFPGGTVGKNLSANAGDARETRSTPGSRICP